MARDGYVTAPKDSQDRHVAFLERYVVKRQNPQPFKTISHEITAVQALAVRKFGRSAAVKSSN